MRDAGRGVRWRDRLEPVLLAALAGLLALAVCGHFIKPHGDFFEFRETGRTLLRGELPETLKRAPIFPLLIAVGGTLIGDSGLLGRPPDQAAAEILNAALLPINVLLVYAIGRHWIGAQARWPALWFCGLALGLWCTAHAIVEPLLTGVLLSCVAVAQRSTRNAYWLGALAPLVRYDAAGLLVGLALCDVLVRGTRTRTVLLRASLAGLPLLVWLGLTLALFESHGRDHYLAQIAERPTFAPLAAARFALDAVFPPDRWRVPVWLAEFEPLLRVTARTALAAAGVWGAVSLLRRRAGGSLVAVCAVAGWIAVHAVFPFGFARFGYPLAPFLLVFAAVGVGSAGAALGRVRSGPICATLAGVLVVGVLPGVFGELLSPWPAGAAAILLPCGWLVISGVALLRTRRRGLEALAALCMLLVVLGQIRRAPQALGTGREMIGLVEAARWVEWHAPADAVIVSPMPGLLRLYAEGTGVAGADRFPGYEQVAAADWDAMLAEFAARGVDYVIWYDGLLAEQGAYYVRKWGLERYAHLSDPGRVRGVELEQVIAGPPRVVIYRTSH